MGRKKYDGVYKGDDGIYWAYHNGKKKTPNTHGRAWDLHREMKTEAQCIGVQRSVDVSHFDVLILRGVPGSGKTTWARAYIAENPWYKRINRDLLRQMFDFGEYSSQNEKFIRQVRKLLIRETLRDGHSVIVDDTNLTDRDIRDIREAAWRYNHVIGIEREMPIPVRIVNFETPLAECVRRDALRPHPVGADRITVMHYDFWRIDTEEQAAEYRAAKKRLGQDRWGWWRD